MFNRAPRRLLGSALTTLLLLAGCASDDGAIDDSDVAVEAQPDQDDDDEFDEDGTFDAGEFDDESFDDGAAAQIDLSLERNDVDCAADDLDPTGTTPFTDAHYVVDGVLGALCLGDGDDTLTQAWNVLATITPRLQLADLALFGAFTGDDEDEVTLAFVNSLDADGTQFQMSVNLESYRDDANEALLTMAHEFSHVFTALPSQLDRSEESAENCSTYDNGEGCFEEDSLMAQWIAQFWGDGLIDEIDPNVEAFGADGEDRCDANPGFLGAYAASNPEEDFAESFSAFVFGLDVETPELQAKLDWMAEQPGLVEFRDRAAAADFDEVQNNFERCG